MNIAVGDGSTTAFNLPNHADIWHPKAGTPQFYIRNWNGDNLLYSTLRTNILLKSEEFKNATYWSPVGLSLTTNAGTFLDNSTDMINMLEDSSTGTHQMVSNNVTLVAGTIYCYSLYVKPNGRIYTRLFLRDPGTFAIWGDYILEGDGRVSGTDFNSGCVVSGAGIEAKGNGWYRIWLAGRVRADQTAMGCRFYSCSAAGTVSFTGDITKGLYVTKAQVEAGTSPTKYIKTGTSVASVTDYSYTAGGYPFTLSPAPSTGEIVGWDGSTVDRGC